MGILLARTAILYVIIVFALRIMGKRQMGELQPSEFVVTILVSNLATLTMEDADIPLLCSMVPIFALVVYEVLTSYVSLKSDKFRKILTGNSCVIIKDGVLDQRLMRELRWSIDDLMEQLRICGIFDIGEVSCAIIETSGKLSVFKRFEAREATAGMLKLPLGEECDTPPVTVISDGAYVPGALEGLGVKQDWVEKLLEEKNLVLNDVFILTLNCKKQYYLAEKLVKNGGRAK
jgi:uncharacterized membrane protein YcaP (DUF421 family)